MKRDQAFSVYGVELQNCSGCQLSERYYLNNDLFINVKITALSGNLIEPSLPVQMTKATISLISEKSGRILGIDNYEKKPIHAHCSGAQIFLAGSQTLGTIGSYSFNHLFINY